jgi:predicted ATPase with chaperone activity
MDRSLGRLTTSLVHCVAGLIARGALTRARPFRSPHHSASMAALTGGGLKVKPGEVSLAHNGVLFLDELPEFGPQALDSLRQPLETGEVTVARANAHVRFPARVQLVAAMNPCRWGGGRPGGGAEGAWLGHIAALDAPAKALMTKGAEARALTARGWTRTLRLARTIADLEGGGPVRRVHVAEALIYRRTGAIIAAVRAPFRPFMPLPRRQPRPRVPVSTRALPCGITVVLKPRPQGRLNTLMSLTGMFGNL